VTGVVAGWIAIVYDVHPVVAAVLVQAPGFSLEAVACLDAPEI
jgi:hypothetical protein